MATLTEIQELTESLDQKQMGELAEYILNQLGEKEADEPELVKSEWNATISRRVKEIKDGTVELIDGDEVMRKFRERFNISK